MCMIPGAAAPRCNGLKLALKHRRLYQAPKHRSTKSGAGAPPYLNDAKPPISSLTPGLTHGEAPRQNVTPKQRHSWCHSTANRVDAAKSHYPSYFCPICLQSSHPRLAATLGGDRSQQPSRELCARMQQHRMLIPVYTDGTDCD